MTTDRWLNFEFAFFSQGETSTYVSASLVMIDSKHNEKKVEMLTTWFGQLRRSLCVEFQDFDQRLCLRVIG